jgi:polyhydroxybutyrate depolymerase
MSNWWMFSYTLACNLTNEFSAIASVAWTDNNDTCSPSKSISVLHIHARNDGHVLFEGWAWPDASNIENETEFVSVDKTIFRWIDNESCNKTPKKVLEVDWAYCEEYSWCSDNTNVKLCVTEEWWHSWPGGKDIPRETSDIPTQAINATDIIWEFFSSNIK